MTVHIADLRRYVGMIAALRCDGEGTDGDGEPFVLENDDAFDTLHSLIGEARALLGWTAGSPPLDNPELYGGGNDGDL